MRTSVLVPVHNAEPFIGAALDSVRAQTRQADEVLVVDDGSTDNSALLARRMGAVVVALGRHRGLAAARNVAAAHATGDVLLWLDADDLWLPDHVETLLSMLEKHQNAGVAFARVRLFGDRVGEWPVLLPVECPVDAFEACLKRCVVPHNAVAVRASVMRGLRYDEQNDIACDYDFWVALALRTPFVATDRITALWRRHEGSMSKDIRAYWKGEYLARERLYSALEAQGNLDTLAALRAGMTRVWLGHLEAAWHSRRSDHFDFHLSMADFVPNAAPHKWRAYVRRAVLPLVRRTDPLRRMYVRAPRAFA